MKLMKGKPIKNLGKPSDIHQALFVCVQTYLVTKKEGFTIHVFYLTKYTLLACLSHIATRIGGNKKYFEKSNK